MAGQEAYLGRIESIGRNHVLSGWFSSKHPLRHLDLSLFTAAVALAGLGCVAIFSATRPSQLAFGHDPNFYLKRQLAFLALSLVIFVISMLFDYRQLRGLAPVIYLGGLGLLLVVLVVLVELNDHRLVTVPRHAHAGAEAHGIVEEHARVGPGHQLMFRRLAAGPTARRHAAGRWPGR